MADDGRAVEPTRHPQLHDQQTRSPELETARGMRPDARDARVLAMLPCVHLVWHQGSR